ncbi:MAG TPA: sulfurtransferase, partial [Burkholderiaceae bacterium]|nr:sulfurtransferase [Burkholderiaceae bacterium]
MYTTLITVDQLQALQASGQRLAMFDCTCDLMNPAIGPQAYAEAHIAGARYADLNTDLSAHHPADGDEPPASGGRRNLRRAELRHSV